MLKGLSPTSSRSAAAMKEAIKSFVDNKMVYAEVRHNFFDKFITNNDGERELDYAFWMAIVQEGIAKEKQKLADSGRADDFCGFKVIYCSPRSIRNEDIA